MLEWTQTSCCKSIQLISQGSNVAYLFGRIVTYAFGYCRYTFRKQEPGSEKTVKRQRSSSIPDDSPDGKRTRAGDSDALLKSVAQLEQSNQV